jgi:uncharacterized caspase-like protein
MSPSGPSRDLGLGESSENARHGQTRDSRAAGRACIAVIGIDRYRAWSRLYNAVGDAKGALAAFLNIGFELLGTALYDEQATGDALRRLVTDDLAVLGPNDSLILFFAGHGYTMRRTYHGGAIVNDGYLIPVDGDRPGGRVGTWLRLETWLSDITRIPAKHILVVIDACHSGLALGPVVQWRSRGLASEVHEPLERLRARRSRRIITSALEDQLAMDGGPIVGHSLFTGCLIEALTGGLLAKTRRSTVTGSEVAQYVQRRVSEYPDSTQTPDFGALALDDRGELLIRLASADRDTRPPISTRPNEVRTVPPSPVPSGLPTGAPGPVAFEATDKDTLVVVSERPAPPLKTSPVDVARRIAVPIPPSANFVEQQPPPQGADDRSPLPVQQRPHSEVVGAAPAHAEPSATTQAQPPSSTQLVARVRRHLVRTLELSATVAVGAIGLLLWYSSTRPDDANAPPAVRPAAPNMATGPHDAAPHVDAGPRDTAPHDAGLNASGLASTIARSNAFIAVAGVRVQSHQVTRREYATYLATLAPQLRAAATPRRGWDEPALDDPVAWTRFEQATAFCAAIGARLPMFAEWNRASGGSWGIDAVGDGRGPLREWTSDVDDGWVRIAGATAMMTPAQRSQALKEKLLLGSAASFTDRVQPDEVDMSSREVGIRCVQEQ